MALKVIHLYKSYKSYSYPRGLIICNQQLRTMHTFICSYLLPCERCNYYFKYTSPDQ